MGKMSELEMLSEGIQFGEKLIGSFIQNRKLNQEEVVIVTLFRKLVEQLDGNYILADHESHSPSLVMIRASLETYLALQYILQKKKFIKDRAYSYFIGYTISQRDTAKYLMENPIEGFTKKDCEEKLKKMEVVLEQVEYNKVLNEWENTKARLKLWYEPNWYSLFNGPRNVNQLIKKIDKVEESYMFYQLLSSEAHGYQAINGIQNVNNETFLKPIRGASNNTYQAGLANSLLNSTLLIIIKNLYPEFENSYIKHLKNTGFIKSSF